MTKKEYFAEIRSIVADREDLVAFVDNEVELLDKKSKSVRKPSAKQIANEGFKTDILAYLAVADAPKTVKEVWAEVESLASDENMTNQRVSRLLKDLVDADAVKKEYVKKVPYFSIG